MSDPVNHPEHYAQYDPEPLDVIEAWGLPFHEAVILQYVIRHRSKNGVEDLRKARFYIDRLIALSEKADIDTDGGDVEKSRLREVRPGDVPPPAI